MSIPRAYQQKKRQKNPPSINGRRTMRRTWGGYKRFVFSLGLLAASYVLAMKLFAFSNDIPMLKNLIANGNFFNSFPFKLSIGSTAMATEKQDAQSAKKDEGEESEEEEEEEEEESVKEKDLLELSEKNQIQTLYQLTARRKEIDIREKKIQLREQKLAIIEKEIAEKVKQLSEVQQEIKKSVEQIDENEKKKLLRLVKIYENMNPKDAARIFNKLDSALLQQLVELMNQKKVALVLSGMDSQRVKDVTSMLAQQKNVFSK